MVIIASSTFLYKQADFSSEVVDEAIYGMECDIIATEGVFVKAVMEYGYTGFIHKDSVGYPLTKANALVSVPFCDLLSEAQNGKAPVLTLPKGSKVDVGFSPKFDRYGFAVLPSKRVYYVLKTHLNELPPQNMSEEEIRSGVVEAALSYLGVQYRWGGKTPSGIDCSGLAFMAYWMMGISIYRDAVPEMNTSFRKIDLNEAKAGDLLYFPGHVAVYLGGGRLVNASAAAGKVLIESINESDANYNEWLAKNIIYIGTYF